MDNEKKIEIVYVPVNQSPIHKQLAYIDGATVGHMLDLSGLVLVYPEIAQLTVGIFGQSVALDTPVKAGDRIEIYRPLLIDPKEKRRQRAQIKR